jgi:elongation factor 2
MTDSLLAAAGLLSPSLAGQALVLDYLEEEQKRQMVDLTRISQTK